MSIRTVRGTGGPTILGFLADWLIVKEMMLSLDRPAGIRAGYGADPVFDPPFAGIRHSQMVLLDEIVGYIDRGSLFRDRWQLSSYPGEGEKSFALRSLGLFQERMLAARSQDLFEPKAAYGFFPVNRDGADLIVWEDAARETERVRLRFRRSERPPHRSVADWFRPVGEPDFAAIQITTLGARISNSTASLYVGEERRSLVDLYRLSLAVLDAFDEYWHRRIRYEWGFGFEDGPSLSLLFDHYYRGERCRLTDTVLADCTDIAAIVALLDAGKIGVAPHGRDLHPELTAISLATYHPHAEPL